MKPNNKRPSEAGQFLNNLESILADASPAGEELAESLREDGFELLKQHAPTWKQKAERERQAALKTLSKAKAALSRTRAETEQLIQSTVDAMQKLGAPATAGAYHQKFQTATDADLESLLEDLEAQYEALKAKKSNE